MHLHECQSENLVVMRAYLDNKEKFASRHKLMLTYFHNLELYTVRTKLQRV